MYFSLRARDKFIGGQSHYIKGTMSDKSFQKMYDVHLNNTVTCILIYHQNT